MNIKCLILALLLLACQPAQRNEMKESKPIQFITLDPGHFHAALVQKSMYPDVDSVVYIYAQKGTDLDLHLKRIESFNTRNDEPTHWKLNVYAGDNFFNKMIEEKPGNVVILSGNNKKKTDYIKQSLEAGFHVLADKPMVINPADFEALKEAFGIAEKSNLLLYDIMTERHEIATILQRELSLMPAIFGELVKGTTDSPAVTKESVHHFYKYVSGSVLTRPAWFMDVSQQGEGLVDVTTHLVDLIQWGCFPEQSLDYQEDINVISAKRWPTTMTLSQFRAITKNENFPEYLNKDLLNDTTLNVYCNGEINYQIKGIHARVSVIWNYQAPEGGGDTHYSIMRGSKANLIIRQGKDTQYKPALYIEAAGNDAGYSQNIKTAFAGLQSKYAGISLEKNLKGWQVLIPDNYHTGHEAHFAEVAGKFLEYVTNNNMPQWEVPNMIAKYYTTTKALEIAR